MTSRAAPLDLSVARLAGTTGRRRLLAGAAATAGTLALPGRALAALGARSLSNVLDAGAVYFPETGHTVAGPFWQHWLRYGLDAFGYPISEPFEDGGGLHQYFQRARFELAPDGTIRLGPLGIEADAAEPPHPDDEAAAAASPDVVLVPETGHTVTGAFLGPYRQLAPVLGPPIGRERDTGGGYIQYFANARLEWDAFGGTRLGLLGSETADRRGIDTTPVAARPEAVTFGEYLAAFAADEEARRAFAASATGGAPFVPAYGQRWIHVSIAQQRIYAYEHTRQVLTDLVSTGTAGKGLTTRGAFAINRRIANEVMDSTTIGYPRGHPKYYRLENVLYTQYYNGGEAIHYAWWHNNFGTPMSYGCVNLRLSTAQWFWNWANFGTPVVVT